MAPQRKIVYDRRFAKWMSASRAAQTVVTLIVLSLDAVVISEWNQNQSQFNFGDNFSLNTEIGDTPFTSVVLATVRHPISTTRFCQCVLTCQSLLTIAAIFYDQVTRHQAPLFWNVYGIVILEFILVVFWVVSFAGMASYVAEVSFPIDLTLVGNTETSLNCCIAIAVLGALVLFVVPFQCLHDRILNARVVYLRSRISCRLLPLLSG
jgi:hypothetical protein